MMNLFIGLCFGIASALALAVMWRMAERLRKEVQSNEPKPAEPDTEAHPPATDDLG